MKVKIPKHENCLKTADDCLSANNLMEVCDLRQNTGWLIRGEMVVCLVDGRWKWSVLSFIALWWGHRPVTYLSHPPWPAISRYLRQDYHPIIHSILYQISVSHQSHVFCLYVSVSQSLSPAPDLYLMRWSHIITECNVGTGYWCSILVK